jgi:hypothetical protein
MYDERGRGFCFGAALLQLHELRAGIETSDRQGHGRQSTGLISDIVTLFTQNINFY